MAIDEKTEEQAEERSVPKPVFTDAEAGAKEFPSSTSRQYNYFTAARQRASVYEDVTVDVQPDPARHLSQGWLYGFADSPGGYPLDWTKLESSDWHVFRDPNAEWEQTIYRNNANVVRQTSQNLANARAESAFERWGEDWVHAVEQHVSAWMHAEHGLGMHVFVPAQRDAPTNMINNAISVNSMHKLRFAQDIAMYNLEISDVLEGFDGRAHIKSWSSAPEWQGVRENVERLTAVRDWGEAIVCTNLVFEPLVGELFRSGFAMGTAPFHGDFVTPTLMGTGESDYHRDLDYTQVLLDLLVKDEAHGSANRDVLAEWIAAWTPLSLAAGEALRPLWSGGPTGLEGFDTALDRCKERTRGILTALDIPTPKEL